ncbi:hypothetical protein GCK72_011791 [Caenorhabditis remanei]|uniref:Uncharacterized protein n=1 Tax=Caenorhabditis remanei TaxID=31234 RepID=A0A6A5H8N8_CAERE|nr:hypothetical protein GCK72_011791 [Caenorhabditis remanei]KAF1763525.1 hypothetical protein GCK72_011791 [Caenorhabditis remanei]
MIPQLTPEDVPIPVKSCTTCKHDVLIVLDPPTADYESTFSPLMGAECTEGRISFKTVNGGIFEFIETLMIQQEHDDALVLILTHHLMSGMLSVLTTERTIWVPGRESQNLLQGLRVVQYEHFHTQIVFKSFNINEFV